MPLAFARQSFPANSQDVADKEMTNFFSYANRVRAQVPLEQPLFFSDLAPIADSTVSDSYCMSQDWLPLLSTLSFFPTALHCCKCLLSHSCSCYCQDASSGATISLCRDQD